MSAHVFVDESKRRDFVLIAATVVPGNLATARRTIQDLYLPGQHGLHMVKEGAGRQRTILRAVAAIDVAVNVYFASKGTHNSEREARLRCLERLVEDIAEQGHANLCLDRDDSIAHVDRHTIARKLNQVGYTGLTYTHGKVVNEPLLAIPDAVAWAWPQGGRWREACSDVVAHVEHVE
ncbi:hypothetical protein [Microlunatus antarcticus]|uniref:DUF3800 domain-containing protein n=1 Tax=Microlunatus antarcticus TaxID=53388 RepID=A0A7W5JUC2_9ACTN|nr:hypothetical protein [Microlunatus antarcticus]MBB3326490.1 hypothetical protein [Microlunatus antarcticus]